MSLKNNKFVALFLFAIVITLAPANKLWAQSYPFDIKEQIYHDGWIDHNKNGQMDPYENPELPISKRIDDLLSRMTLKEKTAQLVTLYGNGAVLDDAQPKLYWADTTWQYGIANIDEQLTDRGGTELLWPPAQHAKAMNNVQRFFIEQTRLGIPVGLTNEGLRGLKAYRATSFPVAIGQASTWNTDLINKIAHVVGQEARMLGYTNVYAPQADVARDPRWGRIPTTFGESPYLVSRMSVAMTKGLQAEGVASTLKHFAVYGVPKGGRDGAYRTDPHVTPRALFTIHLPPFKAAVEAGALGVMSSYNDYNGIPVTGSYFFLTKLLRQRWGFEGYVVTDSGALVYITSKHNVQPDFKGAIKMALLAGVNVRTTFAKPSTFLEPLRELVRSGKISMEVINQRVRDVLRVKFRLGLFDDPYVDVSKSNELVRTPESLALALKAAKESLVLLKNKNDVLPLDKDEINSILVAGPNADKDKLFGRYGPFGVEVTSVLEGIKASVSSDTKVRYVEGVNIVGKHFPKSDIMDTPLTESEKKGIQKAVRAAKKSDVAIVVVGENMEIVGEFKSRLSLQLPGHQLALVKAIQQTGTPTIVVLINGRPLAINWIDAHVPAILEAWFPGAQGGKAIAAALFGKYNPGGSLPVTFPKAVGQVPFSFPFMPSSQSYRLPGGPDGDAWARVVGPLYPFGYGLSYTTFAYSNLRISPDSIYTGGRVTVKVDITNTGHRKGDEVVQLYINQKTTPVITPVRRLRGFKRITLKPGQTKTVTFTLTPDELQILNKHRHWEVMPGHVKVMIGSSSVDIHQRGSFEVMGEEVNKMYTL